MIDWDDAFACMAHIPGSDALPAAWHADAQAYRDSHRVETDLPYGDAARQRFDLVWPEGGPQGKPRGLVVFVHGGFWMKLSKDAWTQYAEGARAAGWAVALPSYTIAPEGRIRDMTQEIGAAVSAAAARVEGPLCLVGHSAGGHLVSRLACAGGPLATGLRDRLSHVLSLSGLHDLRALTQTSMNAALRLDAEEAEAESPALLRPLDGVRVTAWVGGGERPEFLRQTRLLTLMWQGLGARITTVEEAQHTHFTVLDGLRTPGSDLMRCLLS